MSFRFSLFPIIKQINMKTLIFLLFFITIYLSACQCQEHQENKTTTTTHKPETTTSTTTVAPTKKPEPEIKNLVKGNITALNNTEICLRYYFVVLMRFSFKNEKNATEWEEIYLPQNAKVFSDNCKDKNHEMLGFQFNQNDRLELTFEQNEASVYLASIIANIGLNKKQVTFNITDPNPNFNVDKSHSYVCANNVTIKSSKGDAEFIFSEIRLQAFMPFPLNGKFYDEHNCQNEINDVVPIAVGAALTSLVIIVMIAYFIGRRRSRRLAYQSV